MGATEQPRLFFDVTQSDILREGERAELVGSMRPKQACLAAGKQHRHSVYLLRTLHPGQSLKRDSPQESKLHCIIAIGNWIIGSFGRQGSGLLTQPN